MPRFAYTAIDAAGQTVTGTERADSRGVLGRTLAARGLQLSDAKVSKGFMDIELSRAKVPKKDLMHVCRQMAVFLRAGVPVVEALDVIRQEANSKALRESLADMCERIEAGESFASAAAAHPETFPPMNVSMLRSAELTGHLDGVLDQLATYIDRDLEARRKITAALVYPSVVLMMSIVAVVVLTVWVIPRFEGFFKSLNAKLPLPTRMLLSLAQWLTSFWFVPVALIALAAAGVLYLTRSPEGRKTRDALMLKLPLIGELVRDAVLERFCRILATTSGAGVPLPDALAVAADSTNNHVYRRGVQHALQGMLAGRGLAAPLAETDLFPAAARQMIRVGEDTGSLGEQLETAAIYFDRELDYKLKRFTNLFEPAVILVMGLVVGFVAIALISAMYGIFNQVQVPK
ncbi:MAG TPA: type II secretion system F family protein [Acidimicrobiales bacterium]|nr:type II secretion system F family protein [Acidimicrobiales bacterium]